MLVSVIIPTYNQSQYIGTAIESAATQTYENLEIIVGDDASSDDTEQVVSNYAKADARIRYIRNSPNLGRVKNYWTLLNVHAKGEWVINLDGDDYFTNPKFIEQAVTLARKYNLDIVTSPSSTLIEDSDGSAEVVVDKTFDHLRSYPEVVSGNQLFLDLAKGYGLSHLGTLYKRSVATSLNYYSKDIISSDWESNFRFILGRNVGIISKETGLWRKHTNNESKNLDVEKAFANIESFISPYRYAVEKGEIPQKQLDVWREKMLQKFFAKYLIRMILSNNMVNYEQFKSRMLQYDKIIGKKVINKLNLFRILKVNPPITHLIFKFFLKQEAMYKELTSK